MTVVVKGSSSRISLTYLPPPPSSRATLKADVTTTTEESCKGERGKRKIENPPVLRDDGNVEGLFFILFSCSIFLEEGNICIRDCNKKKNVSSVTMNSMQQFQFLSRYISANKIFCKYCEDKEEKVEMGEGMWKYKFDSTLLAREPVRGYFDETSNSNNKRGTLHFGRKIFNQPSLEAFDLSLRLPSPYRPLLVPYPPRASNSSSGETCSSKDSSLK